MPVAVQDSKDSMKGQYSIVLHMGQYRAVQYCNSDERAKEGIVAWAMSWPWEALAWPRRVMTWPKLAMTWPKRAMGLPMRVMTWPVGVKVWPWTSWTQVKGWG